MTLAFAAPASATFAVLALLPAALGAQQPAHDTGSAAALQGWQVAGSLVSEWVQSGPVVVYNMTREARRYVTHSCGLFDSLDRYQCFDGRGFELASGALCRLDDAVYRGEAWRGNSLHFEHGAWNYVEDRSAGQLGLFNGNWITGNNNFDSCANESMNYCAGQRWGSWMVGMMALRTVFSPDPRSVYSMAGGVEYWIDNRWGSGMTLYYTHAWIDAPIALIMTQGSTDGSGFDIRANNGHALPTPDQVFAAPLCSNTIVPPEAT
jgi:hypothetical protein